MIYLFKIIRAIFQLDQLSSTNFNFAFTFVLDISVLFKIATNDSSSNYHAMSISELLFAIFGYFFN